MFERPSDQNHYQVLEIDENATSEEVQRAYERAKEIYGSDSVVSSSILAPEERRQILERVTDAYHTLMAEESRRLYDETLAARVRREPGPAQENGPESPEGSRRPQREAQEDPQARPFQPSQEVSPADYVAGTSPSSSPASSPSPPYPRLVMIRPRSSAEAEQSLERVNITLGVKEEATGEFLKSAREASGVDLRSISQETKIGVTMLEYIEEERLDRLPVEVYLRNFVRQYARCLGLEDERVARSYLARIRRLQSKDSDAP